MGDKGIPDDKLINILWSLIVLEPSSEKVTNPLIPKTLEALSKFHRESGLTQDELIKLYQIQLHVQDLVAHKALSKDFQKIIP